MGHKLAETFLASYPGSQWPTNSLGTMLICFFHCSLFSLLHTQLQASTSTQASSAPSTESSHTLPSSHPLTPSHALPSSHGNELLMRAEAKKQSSMREQLFAKVCHYVDEL